jgi:hypothetical protein|eukprot:scaffold1700_cov286-Chaetoceros_neogracile.AAC.14
MKFGAIATFLAVITGQISNSNALSVSPTKSATTTNNNLSSIFAAPFAQFQRSDLKRQLVKAAEAKDEALVLSIVDELSQLNPTAIPTNGLMGYNDVSSSKAPLNGAWKLLYTNAKDAEAPARTEKNSDQKFGNEVAQGVQVKTGQNIDAATGECINFIKLSGDEGKRPFDQIEITIQMTPISDSRVRLDFMRGRALNDNAPLPFLKDFKFNFPPKGLNDLIAILKGQDPKVEPQTYFDILYIDNEVRAHRTGEGKIFVQKRGA